MCMSSGRTWLREVAGDDPVTAPETPTHPNQSQTHAEVGKLALAGGEDVIDVVRSRGVSRRDLFSEFLLCLQKVQKESKIGCSVSHATSITGLPFHNFFIFYVSKNRLFFKNKRFNIMTLAFQLSRSPADSNTTANYQRLRKTTIFFVAHFQLF